MFCPWSAVFFLVFFSFAGILLWPLDSARESAETNVLSVHYNKATESYKGSQAPRTAFLWSDDWEERMLLEVLRLLTLSKLPGFGPNIWPDFRTLDHITPFPVFSQRPCPWSSSTGGSFSSRSCSSQNTLLLSKPGSKNQTKPGLICPAWIKGTAWRGPGTHLSAWYSSFPAALLQKK